MTALSILDIGRRINAASAEHCVLDAAQGSNTESRHYKASQKRLDALLDERVALQDLAITLQPKTLAEASVQIGLLFYSMDAVIDTDDVEKMRVGAKRIERAIVRIARTVAHAAGVDLNQFGETDLVNMMDLRCPEPPA